MSRKYYALLQNHLSNVISKCTVICALSVAKARRHAYEKNEYKCCLIETSLKTSRIQHVIFKFLSTRFPNQNWKRYFFCISQNNYPNIVVLKKQSLLWLYDLELNFKLYYTALGTAEIITVARFVFADLIFCFKNNSATSWAFILVCHWSCALWDRVHELYSFLKQLDITFNFCAMWSHFKQTEASRVWPQFVQSRHSFCCLHQLFSFDLAPWVLLVVSRRLLRYIIRFQLLTAGLISTVTLRKYNFPWQSYFATSQSNAAWKYLLKARLSKCSHSWEPPIV